MRKKRGQRKHYSTQLKTKKKVKKQTKAVQQQKEVKE